MITRRLVVFAGPTANPRLGPETLLVQGVVAVRLDPFLVATEEGDVTPNPDFWDVLVRENFDASAYVRLYEAEMQNDGSIVIKRDLFGPDDYPHTWAGWPIPGDPDKPPSEAPESVPLTTIMGTREHKALDAVRKTKRKE